MSRDPRLVTRQSRERPAGVVVERLRLVVENLDDVAREGVREGQHREIDNRVVLRTESRRLAVDVEPAPELRIPRVREPGKERERVQGSGADALAPPPEGSRPWPAPASCLRQNTRCQSPQHHQSQTARESPEVLGTLSQRHGRRTLRHREGRGHGTSSCVKRPGTVKIIRVTPSASGRGLTLSIAPAWGRTGSTTERLWSAQGARGLGADNEFDADSQIAIDAGYGVGLPGNRGVLTPYAGMTRGDAGSPHDAHRQPVAAGTRYRRGARGNPAGK